MVCHSFSYIDSGVLLTVKYSVCLSVPWSKTLTTKVETPDDYVKDCHTPLHITTKCWCSTSQSSIGVEKPANRARGKTLLSLG